MLAQLLRRGLRPASLAARPARGIASSPPKDPLGPMEAAIGMTTFFVVFLVPSGWILANLEHYKSRE